jgi:quercetin dioxygenase-like cupin family protein
MNRNILGALVALAGLVATDMRAQDRADIVISRVGTRQPRVGPAENFTGTVLAQTLFDTTAVTRAYGASVSFAAGARTAWHSHPRGQTLIVTSGVGRVQRLGGPVREIRMGDVVWIPPGVKNWHGASPNEAMTHLAIQEHLDGRVIEWYERVTDAEYARAKSGATQGNPREQEILNLSKTKWRWMSERKVDSLATLFHDEAVFVHMGGTMSRTQELDVIRGGMIQYKTAEIQEASVRFIGSTAILLNRIRLTAVVGGNEVINPFVVTEVYVQQGGTWKLGSLSFTRLLTPS